MDSDRRAAKMEMMDMAGQLMPKGKPDFMSIVKYPKIETLVQDVGKPKMATVLFLMLKDFCNSVNVVRNMNEDQMIEGAAMLLDECGNFRLEDYVMMFSMAKRGELIKIYDRLDLSILSQVMDAYWERRNTAAETAITTEVKHLETLGNTDKKIETMHPQDAKLVQSAEKLIGAFEAWKQIVKQP